MKVFGLTTGADTAGINIATKRAFDRHAGRWSYRSMVATVNYLEYPVDVPWDQAELERLYDRADVVHIHNTLHAHQWYDNGQGKPTVLMHHGLGNGSDLPYSEVVKRGAGIGAVQVCSTLDLAIREPSVTWLGAPVDVEAMQAIRRRNHRPSRRIRIGHAPTVRAVKGTAEFVAAMKQLGTKAEMVLIEGKPWAQCLELKATCDVFFDQPVLGYGSNAVECWAMGIPVIAGVSDPLIREGMLDEWGDLPFYPTEPGQIARALANMASDRETRDEYAKRGAEHVRRYHAGVVIVERLKAIYRKAPRTAPGGDAMRSGRVRRRKPISKGVTVIDMRVTA